MTCKESTGFLITAGIGESCIDGCVLDVGVSEPVLHERNISASIEQVSGDTVSQAVKFLLLNRKLCSFAILLHEVPESAAVNGYVSVRDEEVRGFIFSTGEIGAYEFML